MANPARRALRPSLFVGMMGRSSTFLTGSRGLTTVLQPEKVSYMESTFSFSEGSVFTKAAPMCDTVGNTPVVFVEDNIYAKLEGHNPGGSLKDRTLTSILMNMFEDGRLKASGETICLVTSGSAGVSLKSIHDNMTASGLIDFNVIVVIPEAYSHKSAPTKLSNQLVEGKSIFFDLPARQKAADHLLMDANGRLTAQKNRFDVIFAEGVFIDILAEYEKHASNMGWSVLEQHYDPNSINGHKSTAQEILMQVPGVTDVVVSTGTGATAAGLRKFLPDRVTVHSRPAESGTIDGLTDVRRYNNFCDPAEMEGYTECVFRKDDAEDLQQELKEKGIEAGPSSGATFWLARTLSQEHSTEHVEDNTDNRKYVIICADGTIAQKSRSQPTHPSKRRYQSRRMYSTTACRHEGAEHKDYIIVGGGPVGASTAWFLSEQAGEEQSVLLIHDPKNKGAHEDWSRLARLSFDGPRDEFDLSKHAIELLDLMDEVQSMNSGAPVVPIRPGMLFLASPGTPMAQLCANGETYGDSEYRRVDVKDLDTIYPGNEFNLPEDTLCWTHPTGYCVSPLELASSARKTAEAYGAEIVEGRAAVDNMPTGGFQVTLDDGMVYETPNCMVFAGAQNKRLLAEAVERDPVKNAELVIPEFDETYISAISTIRYNHVNHPANPKPGSGHVVPPITLGQLEIPGLIDFQANFSIVAEEYGDVLKTRLSGSIGSETIPTVAAMYEISDDQNDEMADIYQNFFGTLFPFLDTAAPLDFNRCVTYRNHNPNFSGTSILAKKTGSESSLLTTVGCFGVGVKFGPALGEAASAHVLGNKLKDGMDVFFSGDESLSSVDDEMKKVERAW